MKNIKKIIASALLVGLLAATAACGNSSTGQNAAAGSQSTAASGNPSESKKEIVKIAYLPITHALPVFVENELQKKVSENYEIQLVKYGSWPELLDALNTGHVDGASVLIQLAMKAKEQGIGVTAVALGHKDGNVVIASKKINTAADLKGKTIAIPHRQSSHNILIGQTLKSAGLTYKDVKIVELAPPEMPVALASGQIDAYSVAEPFGAKSVALDTGKVLFDSSELWHDSICCSLVLNDNFIKNRQDIAKSVVSRYREAGEYIGEHADEVNTIAKDYLKLDDNVLDLSMKWISYDDLTISKEAYDDLVSKMKEFDISQASPSYEDFVDTTLSDK